MRFIIVLIVCLPVIICAQQGVGIAIDAPSNRLHVHDTDVYMTGIPPFVLTFGDTNHIQITNGVSGTGMADGLRVGVGQGGQGQILHPTVMRLVSGPARVQLNAAASSITIDSSLVVSRDMRIDGLSGDGDRPLIVDSAGNVVPGQLVQGAVSASEIKDIDGNVYQTVVIGTQEWMAENLRTTRFNDGSDIPHVPLDDVWVQTFSDAYPAYSWYNNTDDYKYPYGALYNWYALDNASNGGRNVCPLGWHVPSEVEWTTLVTFLGGTSTAGGPMKSTGDLSLQDGLWASPNTGATNSSGFTALPGGFNAGFYADVGNSGNFWSTTSITSTEALPMVLTSNSASATLGNTSKFVGLSVRCVKD